MQGRGLKYVQTTPPKTECSVVIAMACGTAHPGSCVLRIVCDPPVNDSAPRRSPDIRGSYRRSAALRCVPFSVCSYRCVFVCVCACARLLLLVVRKIPCSSEKVMRREKRQGVGRARRTVWEASSRTKAPGLSASFEAATNKKRAPMRDERKEPSHKSQGNRTQRGQGVWQKSTGCGGNSQSTRGR